MPDNINHKSSFRAVSRQLTVCTVVLVILFLSQTQSYASELLVLDGYDHTQPVKASNQESYICLNAQFTPSFWEYAMDGDGFVAWQSPVVTQRESSQSIAFLIAVGLSGSKGITGWHRLTLNGKKVCDFNTPTLAKMKWQGPGGTVTFHTLYIDSNNDLFGVMQIQPNQSLIIKNMRQAFKVTGMKNFSKSWFMLNQLSNVRPLDIPDIQKKQNIARKIESAILVNRAIKLERKNEIKNSRLTFCTWFNAKKAALSFSDESVSLRGNTVINFFAKGKKLPDDANLALDNAVKAGTWINEIWPAKLRATQAFKDHLSYVQRLSCVLWQTDKKNIREYAIRRAAAVVETRPLEQGRIAVSVTEPEPLLETQIPLTVRILLSQQTWEAKVFTQAGKQLLAQYEISEGARLIRFDVPTTTRNFIIVYKNYTK